MELRDIRFVSALAEYRNFSRAAEALYISQPALSKIIRQLENELGVSLFVRKKNDVMPTAACELFLINGKKILDLCDLIPKQLSDMQDLKFGRVTIAISPLLCRTCIPQLFHTFHEQYPNIELDLLELSSSECEEKLRQKKVELAVLPLPLSDHSSFTCDHLFTEEMLLAVPGNHPIHRSLPQPVPGQIPTVSLSAFRQDSFILLFHDQRIRQLSEQAFQEAGFKPNVIFETYSTDTVNILVNQNVGLGFVPAYAARLENTVYYHIGNHIMDRNIAVAYLKNGYLSHAALKAIEVLKSI